MVDGGAAQAVMGNHELNAIAWHTPDPALPGEFLRPHCSPKWRDKNRKQHSAFLAEVEGRPELHAEIVDWFLKLPLWLDLPELQVVHACWHRRFLKWLSPYLHHGRYLTAELMASATREPEDPAEKDNPVPSIFKAVEALTKGIEVPLPDGYRFVDKYGIQRHRVRVRWWDRGAITYRTAALLPAEEREKLPEQPIPEHSRIAMDDKPVFFGHYWLTGTPSPQSDHAVCVDYSAGKGGAFWPIVSAASEYCRQTASFVSIERTSRFHRENDAAVRYDEAKLMEPLLQQIVELIRQEPVRCKWVIAPSLMVGHTICSGSAGNGDSVPPFR